MDYVELLHVCQIKAIEHIARIATDAALIGAEEYAVAIDHGHTRRAVLANKLLALSELNALVLKTCNHMLGSGIVAKDAHVRGARSTALLGIDGKIHRIAAGIHGMDMLIAIDDVVTKPERVNVKSHGIYPS